MQHLKSTLLLFGLILLFIPKSFSQDAEEIKSTLANTWYAVKVGEPEGGEMNPTSRKETLTLNADGTMHVKDGNIEMDAKWELEGTEKINVTISFDGGEQVMGVTIREVSENKLVLVFPQKSTEYSTSPPDPSIQPKKAPLYVGSDSNINGVEWSGLHPFNKKIMVSVDGKEEKVDAVGVVILLMIDGKKTLRINDDGVTTDIVVSGGSEIAGSKHYGFVTDDPELAGEIVFNGDGSFYVFRDKDQSSVAYVKE